MTRLFLIKNIFTSFKTLFVLLSFMLVIVFDGCAKQQIYEKFARDSAGFVNQYTDEYVQLNVATRELSKQLVSTLDPVGRKKKIVVTSFVNLNNLRVTTPGGRLIAESMINELYKQGFGILDYRGQNAIVVNKDGEFHLTRNADSLRSEMEDAYIFVATYFPITDESIIVNARILGSFSGEVLSTAQILYHHKDCTLFDSCKKVVVKKVLPPKVVVKKKIYIEELEDE